MHFAVRKPRSACVLLFLQSHISRSARTRGSLQSAEVIQNLRTRPILRRNKLPSQYAVLVDYIALGNLHRAIHVRHPFGRIANRQEVHMIQSQKLPISSVILIAAYRHHRNLRHTLLQCHQAWNLFDTRDAPGRPEIQNHDTPTQLLQVHGSASVADSEFWCSRPDPGRVIAAVA